ncbi:MAG: hypothetical protein JKY33_04920 [Bacteroidia bacterium]|nr:hypothetical protein [Bacteroidia bacterium]
MSKLPYILLITFFIFSACGKNDCDNYVPVIVYDKFTKYPNSTGADSAGVLRISFEDCDGDLGTSDTSVFNMFIDYYENLDSGYSKVLAPVYEFIKDTADTDTIINADTIKAGDTFTYQKYAGEDTVNFEYRIPPLTPDGNNKSISGLIEVSLNTTIRFNDEVMYIFYVVDNALNKSNKDTTFVTFP